MFSRRAGFLVEKSVKLLILFYLKSKIDKKLYDVIPLSKVVIIKNKFENWKNWRQKIQKNNVRFMFTQKWRKRLELEQTEERNG